AEVEKRRRRGPFLALEQQRRHRQEQQQQADRATCVRRRQSRESLATCTVTDLIVVLHAVDESLRRKLARGSTARAIAVELPLIDPAALDRARDGLRAGFVVFVVAV